ncbi:MAG: hypothetical protein ACKV2T_16630 [Kofleriaceae bacterium]
MKTAAVLLILVGCSSPSEEGTPDASMDHDAAIDAAIDAPQDLYAVSGMCGVLNDPELLGAPPVLVNDVMTFARAYMDPSDRGLLTPGGRQIAETPNLGGSSEMSEIFAFEQLARCEGATLIAPEAQIMYIDQGGKKTDILVSIDGHTIGVSVTRAFAFPIGTPYSQQQATELLIRKLADVQLATTNVMPVHQWEKQILAYFAIDDQAAQMVGTVWASLDANVKADTILLVTATNGDDLFIYQQ